MTTELATGTTVESVRPPLVAASARLEAEWRAAAECLMHTRPGSAERQRWATAVRQLADALTCLESYAGRLDGSLGRRDWTARRPGLYGVPAPRSSSSASDGDEIRRQEALSPRIPSQYRHTL